MEIFVVTPPDLTEQCQQVLSAIREFPCAASYAFKILGFPEFEQTRQYQRLLRDKFWPGEYRRLKNSISPGPFAFCLEEINLIVINPAKEAY